MLSPAGEPAPDPTLTTALASCLPGGRLRGPLRAYGSVASTQALARAWAEAGAPEGAVVLANHQTAGRGRRGRTWTSAPGHALLLSIVLRPTLPVARWPELALAAGCAVAEAIEDVALVAPRLKWPNDVLLGDRKLAGILTEGVAGEAPLVILGIGVNVSGLGDAWPAELRGRAVALAEVAPDVSRPALLAALLRRLNAWYEVLQTRGLEPVRAAWRARARLGERLRVAGEELVALDLAAGGGLVVRRTDGSTGVVVAGEVEDVAPESEPVGPGGRR